LFLHLPRIEHGNIGPFIRFSITCEHNEAMMGRGGGNQSIALVECVALAPILLYNPAPPHEDVLGCRQYAAPEARANVILQPIEQRFAPCRGCGVLRPEADFCNYDLGYKCRLSRNVLQRRDNGTGRTSTGHLGQDIGIKQEQSHGPTSEKSMGGRADKRIRDDLSFRPSRRPFCMTGIKSAAVRAPAVVNDAGLTFAKSSADRM